MFSDLLTLMLLEWGFSQLISENFGILPLAKKSCPFHGLIRILLAKVRMAKLSEINCEKPHSKSI